jgi:hypothetical protein
VKHIIVEGPDGSGKSTLINHLEDTLGIPVHHKASTSVGGPKQDLATWVNDDLAVMRILIKGGIGPQFIYDRHPIISEPIYGQVVRKDIQPPFDSTDYIRGIREIIYDSCVVVWCLPDLDTVSHNVFANAHDQMPGVTLNIGKVHQAYMTAYFRWRGPKRQYDYRRHDKLWFTDELSRMIDK